MKLHIRRFSRILIIQALYSWQISGNNIIDIQLEFLSNHNKLNVDVSFFCENLVGIVNNVGDIDHKLSFYISRKINNLDQIEKAVLRLAVFELLYRDDIPYKVIINEAIELTKIFGSQDGYKFINGVLDSMIKSS
uniref:Transcription antitermination protein NusB n=1 Tax=Candidatus Aschnera chinzeii TaxID=1485666 RepID=A0AAT9G4F2_9ENTR|nr:MAG: transcription antitermination factor NusB [Candidatus Aschnera chinzeii]